MSLVIYIQRRGQQGTDQLGFDWGSIISQSIPVGVGVLSAKLAPKAPKPCTLQNVTTQGETALCLDQAWQQWQQIEQTATPAEQYAAAVAIRGMLGPPNFSPANTNSYLVDTRKYFDDKIAALKTQPGASPQTAVPGSTTTTIAGFPLTTVLGVAAIGIGLWALTTRGL